MKHALRVLAVVALACFGIALPASASSVQLYLDTAPNASGSSQWPAFRDAEYAAIYNGTFVSQGHSANPAYVGTVDYTSADYMVYGFGDLGYRLHAFYYVPGQTTASLATKGAEVTLWYQWDGVWYNPYEIYGWGEWVTPTSWIDYDGDGNGTIDGVMGSMGNALWGAYGYTSDSPAAQAALAADLLDADHYLGNTLFQFKIGDDVTSLEAVHTPVPEPATLSLLGIGLVGVVRAARRRAR